MNIVEIKNKLGNGCTVPYVVWCDDGKTYVVKFPGNPEGKRALVNEFVASKLCEYLELPIMEYKLINIKEENYDKIDKEDIKHIEGTAFGTLYDDKLLTILNAGMISRAQNSYDAIKILIFDLLIGNYDRNKGNLMIHSISKKIIMIDHTHIFGLGTIWDKYQLPRFINEKFSVLYLHQFNYLNIMNSLKLNDIFYSELNKFIKKVKNIKKELVESIMNDIPSDWEVSDEEKQVLVDYIIGRFNRVDEIIELLNLKGDNNGKI